MEPTILLFDGSPFYPDGNVLFDFADQARMSHMGLSAKYIQAIEKAGLRPANTHDLSALRVIGSTGSTLLPEGFDYVYRDVKKDVCLSSASGGTDIVSCFVGGCPTEPVHRGEIQVAGLGKIRVPSPILVCPIRMTCAPTLTPAASSTSGPTTANGPTTTSSPNVAPSSTMADG